MVFLLVNHNTNTNYGIQNFYILATSVNVKMETINGVLDNELILYTKLIELFRIFNYQNEYCRLFTQRFGRQFQCKIGYFEVRRNSALNSLE